MVLFEKFIKYQQGSIPLIISVAHGGTKKVKEIPTRKEGILGIDKKTPDLALDLIKEIEKLFISKLKIIKSPSYIISKVHRCKIDLNRNPSEAYNVNSGLAGQIYNHYHDKIRTFINYNLSQFKHSLLIDIHGFERASRPKGYRDVEIVLGTNNLETMFPESIPKRYWGNILRGRIIKKFIESEIAIAPGHYRSREFALTGGYITQNYGAQIIRGSQTIQI